MPTLPAPSTTLDPAAVRFGPVRFSASRRIYLIYLSLSDAPRTPSSLTRELQMNSGEVSRSLQRLVEAGLALRVRRRGYKLPGYVRRGPARAMVEPAGDGLEVGRRILICLTEPRRAREIALLIGRSGSCTTGHLRHLLRRGLVVRLSVGLYALSPSEPVRDEPTEERRRVINRHADIGYMPASGAAGATADVVGR